ncbi:AUGMIN subunit 8-like [Phalaenopsis equestris]|uniref:AUGMIN subunit 8-like n=1 Tax=Phalaenopsis equestris TaxID=78828 RepID=UPI0009E59D98|nr:AUGMIN subunit 8-like [Phalaenopsis equestris]XP_020570667.1 AUGMIN subunit 8-like [Phalaenopsis equestris]
MDLFNDKPPKAATKQKLDVLKADTITIEKQNTDASKFKSGPTSKYNSGTTQSTMSCSSSPSFVRKSAMIDKSNDMRAQSTERRRPNKTLLKSSSAPSSPLRRPASSSPPDSLPSTPPSSVLYGIVDKPNPPRRAFGGLATDGLWPAMRSLSSSFHNESFVRVSKKDKPVSSTSLDQTLKNTTKVVSERKRSPLTRRNTSEQSENSRVVDQYRWPAMNGGKVSTMAFSRSMNLIDRIEKAALLMLQSRGLSPARRIQVSDRIGKGLHKSLNKVVNLTSPHVEEEEDALPSTNPTRTSSLPTAAMRHTASSNNASTPSSLILRHTLDKRKGIKGADIEDIHQLRLLHNREVQWRFVNSQAEVALASQKIAAENMFNNLWNVTSELRDSVTMEMINVESLERKIKLEAFLKEQAPYLEDWIVLEGEYSTSLYGTIEALRVNMLRLPVIGGARVDIRAVRNAISSSIDIMQAMGSSVCSLRSRVEGTKRLLCQLSALAAEEKAMLDECRVLLAATVGMQVEECSLRAHILQQLRQEMHALGLGL